MSLLLNDEHLEVLYVLLNDEHDQKYFLPHFQQSCAELAECGYIRLLTRIQKKLKPAIEAPGFRAFLAHYKTADVRVALKEHAKRNGINEDHLDILSRAVSVPIRAQDIFNEINAFDLVNLGYISNIFPHSGTVYYAITQEGKNVYKELTELEPA